MSSTPPEHMMGSSDSWVDLTGQVGGGHHSPIRITPVPPPFAGEQDYLRMLREAQRESNRSSTKVSPISSALMSVSSTTRNTPSASPKSPPNSPNPELSLFPEELKGVYINRLNTESTPTAAGAANPNQTVTASELIWDWTSRPNVPPKEWKLSSVVRSRKSSSSSKLSNNSASCKFQPGVQAFNEKEKRPPTTFSKRFLYTLLLTNLISLILGAGIGMWLSKSGSTSNQVIDVPV